MKCGAEGLFRTNIVQNFIALSKFAYNCESFRNIEQYYAILQILGGQDVWRWPPGRAAPPLPRRSYSLRSTTSIVLDQSNLPPKSAGGASPAYQPAFACSPVKRWLLAMVPMAAVPLARVWQPARSKAVKGQAGTQEQALSTELRNWS